MASARNDRIVKLSIYIAKHNYCSFCVNFNISTVIGLNYQEVYCFAITIL